MPRVLYVEDEPLLRIDGEGCLADAGYDVAAACDGEEACEYLREHGAGLDALITDIDLDGGLSGWRVANLGRQISQALAVVYVTGAACGDFQALGVPRSLLFPKPFEWARVIASLPASLTPA